MYFSEDFVFTEDMYQFHQVDFSNSAHGKALVTLLDEYASETAGGGSPLSDDVKSRLPNALRDRTDYHGILVFAGDTPVGLINAFEAFSTFSCAPILNIHDVVVTASHRRKGITRKMFSEIESIALSLGCCKLTLEVLSNNEPAKAAYHSLGYTPYQLDPSQGQAIFWEKTLKS